MYGFNQETKAESLNGKQFDAGIHHSVELESVEFKSPRKDGEGNPVLMFNFVGPNNEKFRHIEWEIGEQATDPEKSAMALAKRVKHILTKFMPEEQCVLQGSTYAEFANGVITLLGDQHKGKKVAIKLLYNNKGNLVFTKYVGFIAHEAKDLVISKSEVPNLTKVAVNPTGAVETIDVLPF